MKKYEKYKDSGVEWLGEIPEHWEAVKIRRLTSVKRGASPRPIDDSIYFDENGEYSWVRIRDVTASERYLEQTEVKLSELGSSKSVKLEPGNLFLSIAGSVGKPIINKVKCCIHDGFVYFPDLKLNIEFLYYIFTTGELYKGLGKLGTQLNLNTETVGGISIPLPPTNEDIECIVAFLDHKATIIEQLISEKESLITKLQEKRKALINEVVTKGLNPNAPMRDSGIEWLGMIPEHWKVTKINRAFNEIGSGTTPTSGASKYYENGNINWLNTGDLNDGIITETNKRITSAAKKEFSTLKLYPKGSVVIALYGATIGKLGLLEIDTTTNQACCVLSDSKSITQKYLFYFLYSSREHIISLAYGGGQPNISQELIKQLPILQTSIEEQLEIVNFIESRTTKIDATIGEIQLQLQKLKEYKTAVISEVVTGKVDVREWKPQT